MDNYTKIKRILDSLCCIHNKRVWAVIECYLRVKYMHTVLQPSFLETEYTALKTGITREGHALNVGDVSALYWAIRQYEVVHGSIVDDLTNAAIISVQAVGGEPMDMEGPELTLVHVLVFIRTALELGLSPQPIEVDKKD